MSLILTRVRDRHGYSFNAVHSFGQFFDRSTIIIKKNRKGEKLWQEKE